MCKNFPLIKFISGGQDYWAPAVIAGTSVPGGNSVVSWLSPAAGIVHIIGTSRKVNPRSSRLNSSGYDLLWGWMIVLACLPKFACTCLHVIGARCLSLSQQQKEMSNLLKYRWCRNTCGDFSHATCPCKIKAYKLILSDSSFCLRFHLVRLRLYH